MYFDREEPVDPLIDELLQKASKERNRAKFWKLIREANRLLLQLLARMLCSPVRLGSATIAV
jgi:hypothetical protein